MLARFLLHCIGFGNSATSITSPGPTLTFTVGDVVNMTVFNAGTMPHNWALVASNDTSGKVLFGAKIDSGSVPIPVNESASVVFRVTKAGNYFYICQVPGHVQLRHVGQRGSESVTQKTAEKLSASFLFFLASLLTGLVSLLAFGFVLAKQKAEKTT